MRIKSVIDIRTELYNAFSAALPNLDLTEGTPERDIFIEAPIAGQVSSIWDALIYTQKLHAPLVYYEDLEEDEIDKFCATYNVISRAATFSSGTVTFFINSEPTSNIQIVDGSVISTASATPIEFAVDGTYTMYVATKDNYYNATTERWEIQANVRAVNAGAEFRAGSNTVTRLVTPINGLDGVTNDDPITGGEAEESILDRLRRVNERFQGRDLGSTPGIKSYLSIYTRYIDIVTPNDPLMERDEGLGGATDIYIIGEDLETTTDELTVTSTGLDTGLNVNYTSTAITMEYQPVDSISSVIKNGTVLDSSYYTLTKDTGILKKSTRAYDKVELTSTGIANIGVFSDGDSVSVTYIYNDLLHQIEDDLNAEENHFQNRDYLLREMDEVTIDTYLKFKEVDGQDFDTIANSVELAIASFINSIKNTGDVELADIISVVKNITGVDNIDLTTADITATGGGEETAQGDILLGKNEYPISGTITLERWTN